jgi:20S proteasome alpha/beta subunit
MTCIAWDGKTLAADKRACSGQMISVVTKIWRLGDVLFAGSGDPSFVYQMREWVRAGRVVADFPVSQRDEDDWQPCLVIEADGTPSLYERTPYPVRLENRFVAIGSGREYARAAMQLGHGALEAVRVACELDPNCGSGIDALEL